MDNEWNDFVQSRPVRIAMYALCTCFCVYHVAGAVNDLRFPEASAQLVESMGLTGFYAMTAVRLLVMAWATFAFARMTFKVFRDEDR